MQRGLGSTTEVIENREGGDNTTVRKLPGKTTYTDITLKWGLTSSTELWEWRQQIIDGDVAAQERLDRGLRPGQRHEVARWNFLGAWPTKWEGPGVQREGQRHRDRDPRAGARRTDPGMTQAVLVTEEEFELPKGTSMPRAPCTGRARCGWRPRPTRSTR